MSYSEVYCQICGVSFNARRLRSLSEPVEAASGGHGFGSFVEQDDDFDQCNDCVAKCRYDRTTNQCPSGCTRGNSPEDFTLPVTICCQMLRNLRQAPAQHAQRGHDAPAPRCTRCNTPFLWEHIAAPNCNLNSAYNGHNISVQDTRAFNTCQCLVKKGPNWTSDPSDEPLELEGSRYLSGLNDGMISRHHRSPRVFPQRHGLQTIQAENYGGRDADHLGLPFHPSCLEVYKRASLQRFQDIDIEGLIHWWSHDSFGDLPRDQAVSDAARQEWHHEKGQEYLVANPCYTPGLTIILSGSVIAKSVDSPRSSVQDTPSTDDIFQRLPSELRSLLLSFLGSSDIADLRLASRAFHDLPDVVFRDLLRREKPWLWEMWSDMPYSYWTATTEAEERGLEVELNRLKEHLNRLQQRHQRLQRVVGRSEEIQGIAAEMQLILEGIQALNAEIIPVEPLTLPDDMDWQEFASRLQRELRQGGLKGLRNRARIWKDCNMILDRVEAHTPDIHGDS